MSACDPDLCWAEHRLLDGCDLLVCQEHDDIPTAANPENEGGGWLHPRGVCANCDSCWEDVDANRAVTCPTCNGGGELVECQNLGFCSHTNDREYPCRDCAETGGVPPESVDLEGELITFGGCDCDGEGPPCKDAKCQMERDLEMRRMQAQYRAGALTPPRDMQRQMYADAMFDAGRDYLLRDDERMPF